MRTGRAKITRRIGGWLDRHGTAMQPAASKTHSQPVGVMGHLVFVDDDLPFSIRPRRVALTDAQSLLFARQSDG